MDKEKSESTQQQGSNSTIASNPAASGSAADQFQDEFYTSGRIGRRNAMPDILGNNCTASAGGDLPLKLSALTTNESTSSQAANVTETPTQTNK